MISAEQMRDHTIRKREEAALRECKAISELRQAWLTAIVDDLEARAKSDCTGDELRVMEPLYLGEKSGLSSDTRIQVAKGVLDFIKGKGYQASWVKPHDTVYIDICWKQIPF